LQLPQGGVQQIKGDAALQTLQTGAGDRAVGQQSLPLKAAAIIQPLPMPGVGV